MKPPPGPLERASVYYAIRHSVEQCRDQAAQLDALAEDARKAAITLRAIVDGGPVQGKFNE
jgi:hypothetical protein